MKSRYIEETELTIAKWKALQEKYASMTAGPFYDSKMGSTGAIHTAKEYYNRTKFKFKDATELTIDTEYNFIEIEGLRISTDILKAVAKKINEEKSKEISEGPDW